MLMLLDCFQQANFKKLLKLMKIANIDEENVHIFWKNWGNSMKFPERICLMTILKATKRPGFSPVSGKYSFEKTQSF